MYIKYLDFFICIIISIVCMIKKNIKQSDQVSYKSQSIAICSFLSTLTIIICFA